MPAAAQKSNAHVDRLNEVQSKNGFRKPTEFERHERTWMIWPHRADQYEHHLAPKQVE